MICKHCKSAIPENSIFCPICGQKAEAEVPVVCEAPAVHVCSHCGAPMDPNDKFCVSCGKRQEPAAPQPAAANVCAHCGAPMDPNDKFCVSCGKSQEPAAPQPAAANVCPHCGAEVDPNSKFCTSCGHAREAAAPAPAGENPLQKVWQGICNAGKKAMDWARKVTKGRVPDVAIIGTAAVVFVGIIALLVVLLGGGGSSPEDQAEKLMKAWEKGDAKTIYNMIHKDVREEDELEKSDLEDYMDTWEYWYGELEDWTIKSTKEYDKDDEEFEEWEEEYDDYYDLTVKGVARVKVKVEMEDYDGTIELWFVKIGDKWYLGELPL